MSKLLDKFFIDYSAASEKEKRIELLLDFIDYYNYSNFEPISQLLKKELKYFREINYLDGQALVHLLFTYSSFEKGDFEMVDKEVVRVMEFFELVKHHEIKAQILNFLAFYHSHQGNFDKAFEYCYASIKEGELATSKKFLFWGNFTLGVFYFDLKDYAHAENCYKEGLKGFTKHNNLYGAARCQTGLSTLYIENENYKAAEKLLYRSLAYYNEIEETPGQARSLNDLGVIFRKTGKLQKALDYFEQSLVLRKRINHTQGIATSLNEIAEVLIALKDFPKAETYLIEAKKVCEKIKNRSKLYRTHFLFTLLYRNTSEPWKALEHYDLYEILKSEVVGEAANNKINELQSRMVNEKAEKEKEIERLKNVELKKVYDIIEDKNKAITDSINYARRIQLGILPSDKEMKECLRNHFVFYKPKDIVSGDFYWCETVFSTIYNTKLTLIAAIDCTGHGVPGAFMSILGYTLLNQTLKHSEINSPAQVLDYLNSELPNLLKSQDKDVDIKDGMDMSLCVIDFDNSKLYYAGANNPLWIIRNSALIELKADSQPISAVDDTDANPFTNHIFDLQKGDTFYLFTDGYADQFGGEKGKKFSKNKFKELLLSVEKQSMTQQGNAVRKAHLEWCGNLVNNVFKKQEQVDDICVIGVRF